MGLVLGEYENLPDARVDTIGKRKIDDSEFAAKRGRRFCPNFGQGAEPRPTATSHDYGHCAAGQAADESTGFFLLHSKPHTCKCRVATGTGYDTFMIRLST